MAVGVTLTEMLQMLRAEARLSLVPGHNLAQRDAHTMLLRRVQEELYTQFDWPRALVYRNIDLVVGQGVYSYPADLDFERIESVWVINANQWQPMTYGITPEVLNEYSSDTYQTYPPLWWDHTADGDNQFKVFPIPNLAGTVRMRGRMKLRPLVEDTDTCVLDANLIVLYAAAELLAEAKNEMAQLKLQKAQALMQRLKALQSSNKTETFVMGGGVPAPAGRLGLDFIPPGFNRITVK